MAAIETVFDLQAAQTRPWALFLTFRNLPSEWEVGASEQLLANLQKNLDTFPSVQNAFQKSYQTYNVAGLSTQDHRKCMSQAVAKWLVDRAHDHKLALQSMDCYKYTRYNQGVPGYDIYKHAFVFERGDITNFKIPTRGLPDQTWMAPNLVRCIERHKCLDVEDKLVSISDSGRPTIMDELRDEVNALCGLIV